MQILQSFLLATFKDLTGFCQRLPSANCELIKNQRVPANLTFLHVGREEIENVALKQSEMSPRLVGADQEVSFEYTSVITETKPMVQDCG